MTVGELIEYLGSLKENDIVQIKVTPIFTGVIITKPLFPTPTLGSLTSSDTTYIAIPESE